ncbi:MAG: hypothetical protein RIR66_414 [Actinomycetota bacterium]|jgi:NADH:ubiquinone oxidoreductase subunit C
MREVTYDQWVSSHQELKSAGFVRFEYLTANHISQNHFEIFSRLALDDLSESLLVKTSITGEIDSIDSIYTAANFHERELTQMFGIQVIGGNSNELAFDADFEGFPLRKDFALTTRQETPWPGAVEPDEKARRRLALPPGVFETWSK